MKRKTGAGEEREGKKGRVGRRKGRRGM